MSRAARSLIWCVGAALVISACDSESSKGGGSAGTATTTATTSPVLARVDGAAITQEQLDKAIQRTLGESQAAILGEPGRRKMLESMVLSRAMALEAEKGMSADQKRGIDIEAAHFREQLLVKAYLRDHASPQPVTQEMVKAYYDEHPERFGASTMRRIEIIASSGNVEEATRERMFAELESIKTHPDWKAASLALQKRGIAVMFSRGSADDAVLRARLKAAVSALKKGEVSPVTLIDGRAYIVKVTDTQEVPPKPLSEVSGEIRKALLPIQMKKAIDQVSEGLLKKVKVEYANATP